MRAAQTPDNKKLKWGGVFLMYTGYLIYHDYEAKKNSAFIELFKKYGKLKGIDFMYIPYSDYKEKTLPDIVINRTRDASVSLWYEENNVRVLHSSLITETGNDKFRTIEYLKNNLPSDFKLKKWAPYTEFISKEELKEYLQNYNSDKEVVIKSVDGHGGNKVCLLSKESDKEYIYNTIAGSDCIVQEKIESDNNDIRVYIVGGSVYAAMLRHGESDFRSNFSLGGEAVEYHLSESQKEYIMNFVKAFGGNELAMAGIDFILTKNNELIFNELEEMVGSRMLYANTDYNIVKDYVEWIYRTFFNN